MKIQRFIMLTLLAGVCLAATADDVFQQNEDLTTTSVSGRRMLLCCGLPGDDRHREQMTEACQRIIASSKTVLGVRPEHLVVLAGDEEMQTALQNDHATTGLCTRETMIDSLAEAAGDLGPADAYWCLLIGHSHPYGAESQFNVSGRDINQSDFAKAASAIQCREQVFWLTQPISGFWIGPLARPQRIIVTATEADLEFTGTEMPYALAAVLSGESEDQSLEDIDGDGTLSLLDLYLATSLEVTSRFRAIDRLQTEHAQLDDNGDGRGSEVQQPYLPAEPEEEEEADEDEEQESENDQDGDEETQAATTAPMPKPPLIQSQNLDGFRSRYVLLEKPVKIEPSVEAASESPGAESSEASGAEAEEELGAEAEEADSLSL